MKCIIKDCLKEKKYRSGLCPMHYQRDKVHGDPLVLIPRGTKHGLRGHPLYPIWKGIKSRCFNPNTKAFKNYGGRGISLCEEWMNPRAFIEYVEKLDGYNLRGVGADGTTLDRIDNDGNYEPGNVRWASRVVQRHNQRSTHEL